MKAALPRLVALAALLSACSTADKPKTDASTANDAGGADAATPATRERPQGPAADVSEELTGGNGPFVGAATGVAAPDGYVEHEYVAAGTATSYKANGALTDDGRWSFAPATTAPYRTRVARAPPDECRTKFSGTVVVEWLNVSGGVDADPGLVEPRRRRSSRQGDAWVGVSAQRIGVEGGPCS